MCLYKLPSAIQPDINLDRETFNISSATSKR